MVANEVKELAKETAKATEDISQKIEAIQSDTKGAVEPLVQIGTVINQINDIQNTIASAVEEQSATTNEISRNLAEAAKGGMDITQNITGVAEAAHSTTAGAVERRSRPRVWRVWPPSYRSWCRNSSTKGKDEIARLRAPLPPRLERPMAGMLKLLRHWKK